MRANRDRTREGGRARATPQLTAAEIERMLTWLGGELRAERRFAWYRARRPRGFISAAPPAVN